MSDMASIAVIDVGSNAIRLLAAELNCLGQLSNIRFFRQAIRLGTDVFNKGEISAKTLFEFEKEMKIIASQLQSLNVKIYRAVATSAMRDAKNAAIVCERIFTETGIQLEVISGVEESQLSRASLFREVGGFHSSTLGLPTKESKYS